MSKFEDRYLEMQKCISLLLPEEMDEKIAYIKEIIGSQRSSVKSMSKSDLDKLLSNDERRFSIFKNPEKIIPLAKELGISISFLYNLPEEAHFPSFLDEYYEDITCQSEYQPSYSKREFIEMIKNIPFYGESKNPYPNLDSLAYLIFNLLEMTKGVIDDPIFIPYSKILGLRDPVKENHNGEYFYLNNQGQYKLLKPSFDLVRCRDDYIVFNKHRALTFIDYMAESLEELGFTTKEIKKLQCRMRRKKHVSIFD